MGYYDVMARVQEHYRDAVRLLSGEENRIIGCFLYGSQNYGLDTETSDVDTVVLVIPSFHMIVFDKPEIKTHTYDNGEKIVFKDFRKFINDLRCGRPESIELLFTEYYVLGPKLYNIWYKLRHHREDIVKNCINDLLYTLRHIAENNMRNHVYRATPSTGRMFETHGYNYKISTYIIRIHDLIMQYCVLDKSYKDSLICSDPHAMDMKMGKIDKETAEPMLAEYWKRIEELAFKYSQKEFIYNNETALFMHDVQEEMISHIFPKERR